MKENESLKRRIYEIVFEAETREGRIFDLVLLAAIILSVFLVIIETIPEVRELYHDQIVIIEWIFSVLFMIEYLLRIYSVNNRKKYIFSFFGIIDFLAILPAIILLFNVGAHSLLLLRALRLMRIFRILKLTRYMSQGKIIVRALKASKEKILVFVFFIFLSVIMFGSLIYLIEGGINPEFDSIPRSIYWSVVTITTVGYGDISPITPAGQFLASLIMISGYAVLAVPTGIITGEFISASKVNNNLFQYNTNTCPNCLLEGHELDAKFCRNCGGKLL
jgi:voltage-gated potassium channel